MRFKCICIFENNMAKHKLKVKSRNHFNLEAIKAPFKNKNNQKTLAAGLILISLYLLISFTDRKSVV